MVYCHQCFCTSLNLVEKRKQGLAFELKLVCGRFDCDWCHIFWTSKKRSRNYDVNRRIFYSMCRIGNGYNGMKRFLVLMNHPPPMTEKNYRKLSNVFRNLVKHVAETAMKDAALEIHKQNHVTIDNIVDTGVSVDGTWQKRGFTSLNGAVTAISIETGRVLDVEVMTRYCQGCINIAKFRENREMYEHLKKDHECTLNQEESAGKMLREYFQDLLKCTNFATRIIMGMGIPKVLVWLNIFILQSL